MIPDFQRIAVLLNFVGLEINHNRKEQGQMSTPDVVRHPSKAVPISARTPKR